MDFGDFAEIEMEDMSIPSGGSIPFGDFDSDDPFQFTGMEANSLSELGVPFSSNVLPPLEGIHNYAEPTIVSTAAPTWVPTSEVKIGSQSPRATYLLCIFIFTILFIMAVGLVAIGIILLVKLFQIKHDVNHLQVEIVQPVNAPPIIPPRQIVH